VKPLSYFLILFLLNLTGLGTPPKATIHRLVFGSCANQEVEQPIWDAINADKPDVVVMLGDNIYGDSENPADLESKYQKLAAIPGFIQMREQSQLVAIWDDHDYGMNDSGRSYPAKNESRKLFLHFFNVPFNSPRWDQEGGIYTSYYWGEPGQRVQLLLIDTRWDRDDLKTVSQSEYENGRSKAQMGPYRPNFDVGAHMISEAQWQWLEAELQKPADVRIFGSGIQIFSDYSGWECWANFPEDQDRLLSLLNKHKVENFILISGDTHWAEAIRLDREGAYPLWEFTSSGLTQEWEQVSPNKNRMGPTYYRANYGVIDFDWEAAHPSITISIKDKLGAIRIQNTLRLEDLKTISPEK